MGTVIKSKIIFALFLLLGAGCTIQDMTGSTVATGKEETMANKIATIETNKGIIKFELYLDKAPITSKNFIGLASDGFYNGLTFHRHEPGFVIQGGVPSPFGSPPCITNP